MAVSWQRRYGMRKNDRRGAGRGDSGLKEERTREAKAFRRQRQGYAGVKRQTRGLGLKGKKRLGCKGSTGTG